MILLYLIVGIGLLLLLLATARWYAAAPPQQVLTGLRWLAYLGGGGAALWLLLSGRAVQILYLLIPALPLIRRWIVQRRTTRSAGGGQSGVETPWLRMTLDHAAATMEGVVLQGVFQGRKLSELRADDLLDLLARLRVEHPESATLLEAYLDAVHAGWRSAGPDERQRPAEVRDEMSREEAFRILGLEPGASPEAIRQAWREAMKRNHPDQGGSPYLAAKINRAKELLLDA